ncbi:MAG: L-dopachrome tautomerase-related protein [Flammeovirgaceae bacterium]
MKKFFKVVGVIVFLLLIVLVITLRIRYGGGSYYQDLSTEPLFPSSALEIAATYHEPFGNLAVSANGRLFFTIHPESRPETNKVMEWVNNKAIPYPNTEMQSSHFNTVLGMFIDNQNRLWTVDHGNHGLEEVRVSAFDLTTNQLVHDYVFPPEVAEKGSFFNDLQVSADGKRVYVADVSFWGKNPAIAVYDMEKGKSWRTLEGHHSVIAQDWIIQNPTKEMTFFGGLVALKPGIDGIAIDSAGEWIYYGAMTHSGLYRVPTTALDNPDLSAEDLANQVEKVADKPLSDGLSTDVQNNCYITDVEHGAIIRASPDGQLTTLVKDMEKIRWADAISFGPDSMCYFVDSAIPDQMLQSKAHIQSRGPYFIYKFKNDIAGVPGR